MDKHEHNDGGKELYNYFLRTEFATLGLTEPREVNNEDELIQLVNSARETKRVIRVEGSGHSVTRAIAGDNPDIVVRLCGKLRSFKIISKSVSSKVVKVGGGCYLGKNPQDKTSTWENSLNVQLAKIDCAIPILGGITHQSLAGFLMTGSAGGTVAHSFEDVVKTIYFINGKGERIQAERGTDLFNAVGVSLGLYGIITYVELEVPTPSFNVEGTEQTVSYNESVIALGDNGKSRLQETLETTEYYRLLWFPQKYAQRVTEWKGKKSDSNKIHPYKNRLGNPDIAAAASMALKILQRALTDLPCETTYKLIGTILNIFTFERPQHFNDVWYKTIPLDDQTPVDTLFDTEFTEMWFPIDQTDKVLKILNNLLENQQAAGNYCLELYAAKRSPFWMSASYDRDVVRVDVFWFVHQKGKLRDFFNFYWNVLMEVEGLRFHWGKYLPLVNQTCGDKTFNFEYLKNSYPMLEKWLEKRAEMDPDQIFVNDYWRKIFDIKKPAPSDDSS
ncbi:D-arabinono-1,4-lactone oxidase [Holothuria leucospilota]|uniref:D-arabinono-1,4-lactone oxidase n=1 Tax=Holothuria leucospilota TaxID=206669 RepID=A0A9Q1BBW9_HOLLE|nr:D-arabinono-1,4-lactone oxidase [Holothuria leucospilota]